MPVLRSVGQIPNQRQENELGNNTSLHFDDASFPNYVTAIVLFDLCNNPVGLEGQIFLFSLDK